MTTHKLDLGVADVHQPAALPKYAAGYSQGKRMGTINAKKRNALKPGQFALPSQRKYPIHDAAHVRNAAARLEQAKKAGKISSGDYAKAHAAIKRAEKRFGIKSAKATDTQPEPRRLRVRADLGEGGSLHVRHMTLSDKLLALVGDAKNDSKYAALILSATHEELVELRTPCGLLRSVDAGEAGKQVWIQLAKPGTFRGHSAGPFELSQQTFQEIVRNFKATENQRIPIDFEHASEADPTEGSIPDKGAPAQGWIVDMRIQGGELWGLAEWGSLARDYIRAGQYRFFSPAIRFNSKDRVTGQPIGARMTSGALTNNPFLDGMKPLAAKDVATCKSVEEVARMFGAGSDLHVWAQHHPEAFGAVNLGGVLAHKPHEYMPEVRKALSLHPLATAAECADHLDKLRDHFDAVDQDPDATHEGVKLGDYCMSLRNLTGAAPGVTWDEVFDAVEDMIHAAMDEHVIEDHGGQRSGPASMDDDETDMDDEDGMGAEMRDALGALDLAIAQANAAIAMCGR